MTSQKYSDDWAIDAVCNLFTPEVVASRPAWSSEFLGDKIGSAPKLLQGVGVKEHLELMDEAKIERAFLLAPKMGRVGLPQSWLLDPTIVYNTVQSHPDRFSGIIGIDPYTGMRGVRELELMVKEYGFIGAHSYPHWFEMSPDDARFYPFYAKCAELNVPIQMQVGHCLRYSNENPLPSVGKPSTLDTIACHFPELKIIGIHIGWPWTEEMIAVAYKHPNVYIGTDAYAPKYWDPKLIHFINTFGQDKVIFGTDFPVIPHLRARKEITELNLNPGAEKKLLRENTELLYGLKTKMEKGYHNFDHGQVHYLTAGVNGPRIVLLHESPLSNRVFEKCVPALTQWSQIFAPDTPGYGNSDALSKSSTLADYARVIGESIKRWAGDNPVLICGTHTGASLAIEVVNQFPNISSGLFLIGVPFYTESESADRIANWCPDIEISEDGKHLDWAWRRYQKIWPTAPMLDRNMAVLEMLSVSDKYNWGYLQAFKYAVADRIKNVKCALRIAAAENEFLFAGSKKLADQINAEFTVFEGLDGQVPLRAPELFSKELKKFYESMNGSAK